MLVEVTYKVQKSKDRIDLEVDKYPEVTHVREFENWITVTEKNSSTIIYPKECIVKIKCISGSTKGEIQLFIRSS